MPTIGDDKMVWRLIAITLTGTLLAGCIFIENIEQKWNETQRNVIQLYYVSKEKVEQNPQQIIGTFITTIISGAIWISILKLRRAPVDNLANSFNNATKVETNKQEESQVLERAKARAIYNQLKQDLLILEGRKKWLPEQIQEARKRLSKARQNLEDATNTERECKKEYELANSALNELITEDEKQYDEIIVINMELERLKSSI